MKNFFNGLIDVFTVIFSRLSMLAIVLVLCLIIFSRLNNLFDVGIMDVNELINRSLNNEAPLVEEEKNEPDQVAKIVYKGEIPSNKAEGDKIKNPEESGQMVNFEITEGQSPEEIATLFLELGLISDPPSFIMLLEEDDLLDSIKAGSYQVDTKVKNRKLIAEITGTEYKEEVATKKNGNKNSINLVTFEILEGQNIEEVVGVLREAKLIEDTATFLLLVEDANLADEIKPGVYRVPSDIKNLDLLETITIATQ